MQKTILCYGDSNTWGFVPGKADYTTMYLERYSRAERWTGVLQKLLGSGYYIVEEGLNGRTTNIDHKISPDRNGKTYLLPCLYSHAPVDLVILSLGGNDLKTCFNREAPDVCAGLRELIEMIQSSKYGVGMQSPPEILIVSQPITSLIIEELINDEGLYMFKGAIKKAKELVNLYANLANEKNCYFLDVTADIKPSEIDGLHLDKAGHGVLALLIRDKINKIYD